MKKTAGIILACSMLAVAFRVTAQNVNVNAGTNTNANTNQESVNASTGKANFKDPAALKPLLLVPLAGALFLIYDKLAKRNE